MVAFDIPKSIHQRRDVSRRLAQAANTPLESIRRPFDQFRFPAAHSRQQLAFAGVAVHRQIRFDKHFDPSTSVGVQNQGHEILSLVVKCR